MLSKDAGNTGRRAKSSPPIGRRDQGLDLRNQALKNLNERSYYSHGCTQYDRNDIRRPTLAELHLLNALRRPVQSTDREEFQQNVEGYDAYANFESLLPQSDEVVSEVELQQVEENNEAQSLAEPEIEHKVETQAPVINEFSWTRERKVAPTLIDRKVAPTLIDHPVAEPAVYDDPANSVLLTEQTFENVVVAAQPTSIETIKSLTDLQLAQTDEELERIIRSIVESLHEASQLLAARRRQRRFSLEFVKPIIDREQWEHETQSPSPWITPKSA